MDTENYFFGEAGGCRNNQGLTLFKRYDHFEKWILKLIAKINLKYTPVDEL